MPKPSGRITPTSLRARKEQTSLRGAKRRGNLYQVVVVQNEAARQRREIATPSGLAMTTADYQSTTRSYSTCTIKPDLLQVISDIIVYICNEKGRRSGALLF